MEKDRQVPGGSRRRRGGGSGPPPHRSQGPIPDDPNADIPAYSLAGPSQPSSRALGPPPSLSSSYHSFIPSIGSSTGHLGSGPSDSTNVFSSSYYASGPSLSASALTSYHPFDSGSSHHASSQSYSPGIGSSQQSSTYANLGTQSNDLFDQDPLYGTAYLRPGPNRSSVGTIHGVPRHQSLHAELDTTIGAAGSTGIRFRGEEPRYLEDLYEQCGIIDTVISSAARRNATEIAPWAQGNRIAAGHVMDFAERRNLPRRSASTLRLDVAQQGPRAMLDGTPFPIGPFAASLITHGLYGVYANASQVDTTHMTARAYDSMLTDWAARFPLTDAHIQEVIIEWSPPARPIDMRPHRPETPLSTTQRHSTYQQAELESPVLPPSDRRRPPRRSSPPPLSYRQPRRSDSHSGVPSSRSTSRADHHRTSSTSHGLSRTESHRARSSSRNPSRGDSHRAGSTSHGRSRTESHQAGSSSRDGSRHHRDGGRYETNDDASFHGHSGPYPGFF